VPPSSENDLPPTLRPGDPLFGLGYAPPVLRRAETRISDGVPEMGEIAVAEEVPVSFVYNGRPHVVMMASPSDLEDFAIGFSLAEGIVDSVSAISRVDVVRFSEGIELQMTVPAAAADRLASRNRQFVGRTGCGLCGVETIREAIRPVRRMGDRQPIAVHALWRAEAALGARQAMNSETGSMHAAGWATRDGDLEVVREDVGRHNALDKVLGALARENRDAANGFVVMTSRASYELVQKASTAGIPLLAAISRPTGLAIRLAESAGMTLVGLLRGRSAIVYSGRDGLA
jgi:FdhD protein